ncbi:sugar transferase [Sorangium cellulosum]|uniref:Sugar transferase n=1 Tax=Sorangium cellulosum TaxID=56 RepID=A0A4P2Q0K3_SORCE|nr:TIGR03013 family XrtA/PEP-CTERM system glycosyltransferase [Sorangium cellulosum]AUX22747.1 sugar transferase [Sorangium cellulosum]
MLELFRSPRRTMVWFVEASLLSLLVCCAPGVLVGWEHALDGERFGRTLSISLVAQASLYYHGLYGPEPPRARALFLTMFRALGVAAAVLWLAFWIVPDAQMGDGVVLMSLGAAALVLPAWRAVCHRVLQSESFSRLAVVLGAGELARSCARIIRKDGDVLGLRFAGRLVRDDEPIDEPDVAGRYRDLRRLVEQRGVSAVIVATADRRAALPIEELLELKLRGVEIEEGIELYERVTGKIFVRELKPSQIIFSHGFSVRRRTLVAKRAFDVVCATVGLLLGLPLMALTAVAVKLDSSGPALYSQIRTGAFGKPFRIHKFRSMRTDAEKNGAVWAMENDPRVTRVGRFIRKTRLDELPQLWNVLVGEMSMVGPRPERPEFIDALEKQIPFFRQRLCVKPGVTGHAQVRCRYGASAEDALEKLQYDLYYMKSFSIWFDISILIDTVKVVLWRIGAR